MSVAVVIVAAGRGRRLGGEMPKQYIPLGAKCALRRTAEVFLSLDAVRWIVPVIHPDDRSLCGQALQGLSDPRLCASVDGAETRAKSVRNGLEQLAPRGPQTVLIHDAARPFVPPEVIARVIAALQDTDGACAALPVVDALWQAGGNTAQTPEPQTSEALTPEALAPIPRDGLWRAQTPQGFDFAKILAAHRSHDGTGADDVAVARDHGLRVAFVPGSEQSYKITTAEDLARALADARLIDSQTGA